MNPDFAKSYQIDQSAVLRHHHDYYGKQQYTRPCMYPPREVMSQQANLNYSVVAAHHNSRNNQKQHQPGSSGHHRPGRTSEGDHHSNNNNHHQRQRPYNSHAKGHYLRRKRRRMKIKRPVDAPPAPENSTQFIINDLEQRAGPLDLDSDSGPEVTTEEFEEKDFEAAFNGARFEELMGLERTELVERYQSLETSVTDLQRQLNTTSNNNGLDNQLQALREENQKLKRNNQRLRSELRAKSDESSASNQEDDSGGLFAESTEPMPPWGVSPRPHGMVTVGTSPRRPPSVAASPARSSQFAAVISSPHHASRSPLADSRSPIHAVHSPQLLCIG